MSRSKGNRSGLFLYVQQLVVAIDTRDKTKHNQRKGFSGQIVRISFISVHFFICFIYLLLLHYETAHWKSIEENERVALIYCTRINRSTWPIDKFITRIKKRLF